MSAPAFHPNQNMPGCMMPDGGDCCEGHAAVCDDWHKKSRQIDALVKALEKIAAMDPKGIRADDLGRAARIAADGIKAVVGSPLEPGDKS